MFVDLVGFTSLSEGKDPEDVRLLLSDYFQKAEEIIGLYGGVVEKFIGDAVMAVWGTPVAREDDTGRSVRAALELVEAVAALGRSVGGDLMARAGVFTGEAAVNIGAVGQGMVAGDMVNTASRLQSAAEPGTVVVDRSTYLGARDAVAFDDIGGLTLKGKEEPVEAWRALRVIGFLGGVKRADALEPAFTGRDEELRAVKDLLHSTGRESKPKLASILGMGGIGKSRLIWELYKYVDGLSDVLLWHQGRSPSYGEGVAFWSLGEMVRMRARIAETDDDDAAFAKLDASLAEFIADVEERNWLRPFLAQLLGLEEADQTQREHLFAAWRTFFERLAEHGTVILIFEDLHWADSGLVDFIEHLMAWARSSPILIVTLARPELLDRRPNWGAGQRNFVSIHLEPLLDDDMTLLLKSLTSDLPETMRDDIVRRAEGVPLYAVEMVRMLIDRGDLVVDGDGYRWVGQAGHIDVPDSLHSLIASRLDVLSVDDRLLVQDASVLGKTFTTPALAALTGIAAKDLERRLQELARREIFLIDNDPRSPERGQYGFVQSLIREVAYQTLSNHDRRERHIAAAKYFESIGEADMIDVVATHYMEAYNNSRKEESEELADRARVTLTDAAKRAETLGSPSQALLLFEKALTITSDGPDRTTVLYRAGRAAALAGTLDVAVTHLTSAVDSIEPSADPETIAEIHQQLAKAYFLGGRVEESEKMLVAAIGQLEDPEDTLAGARLYTELARMCIFNNETAKGEYYTSIAMPPLERANNIALISECLITRGVAALISARAHEAEALLYGALRLAESHGLVRQQIRALVNIAANQLAIHPAEVMQTASEGFDLTRRYGIADSHGFLLSNAVEAVVHLGRWEEARKLLQEGSAEEIGDFSFLVQSGAATFEAYAGDLDEAERRLEIFRQYGSTSSSTQDQLAGAGAVMAIAIMRGDYDGVLETAATVEGIGGDEALAPHAFVGHASIWGHKLDHARKELERQHRSTIRNEWFQARLVTLKAGIAALEGDRERALELYGEAFQIWNALDIPLGKAMSQVDMALALGGPEAEQASSEAEAFFAEPGNTYIVERLRAAR
jgi:class 3 adenylate cyclase/tetratricopeptide (TPR) repeat protein